MRSTIVIVMLALSCGGSGSSVTPPRPDLGHGMDIGFADSGGSDSPAETSASCVASPDPKAAQFDVECAGQPPGCWVMTPKSTCACLVCDGKKCVKAQYMDCPVPDGAEAAPEAVALEAVAEEVIADVVEAKDPGADTPKDVAPDPVLDMNAPESKYCEDISPSPIPIGHPCQDNCECETGLCYREAYTLGIGICSKECIGEAGGTGCPDEGDKFKCLIFTTALKDTYGLTIMSLCMPICNSLQDCKAISDVYGYCPGNGKTMTTWEGATIGGQATCQIKQM